MRAAVGRLWCAYAFRAAIALPQVKQAIRNVSLADCEAMATRSLEYGTAREVDAYLQGRFAELLPEMAIGA